MSISQVSNFKNILILKNNNNETIGLFNFLIADTKATDHLENDSLSSIKK